MLAELVKTFLKKLKTIFVFDDLAHHLIYWFIFLISIIYIGVYQTYPLIIIPLALLIYGLKENKTLFILMIISLIIVLSMILIREYKMKNFEPFYLDDKVKVVEVSLKNDYDKVIIKYHKKKYIFNSSTKGLIHCGDTIYLKGQINLASKSHYKNTFNYYNYLKNNNIYGLITVDNYQILKRGFNIYSIHEKLTSYVMNHYPDPAASFILALTIGEKNELSEDVSRGIQKLGIGHLFVVSGLHMQILGGVLSFVLRKFRVPKKSINLISLIFFGLYYIISGLMISILRVILSTIITGYLAKYLHNFTSIDKFVINAGSVLMINPYYLFNYSYLLSYSIVLMIVMLAARLSNQKGIKNYLTNSLKISLGGLFMSLPIVSILSGEINLLQILNNLFFIPLVSYVVLPLSLIVLFISPLKYLYNPLIKAFIDIVNLCSRVDFLTIKFPAINIYVAIIYYGLLFLIVLTKRNLKRLLYGIIFGLLILCWNKAAMFQMKPQIDFIDIPKGDATLFVTKGTNKVILIDCGDNNDVLVRDLISKGIKKIDYLFITHSDSDHLGGFDKLAEKIKIRKVFISVLDNKSYEYLLAHKKKKTAIYLMDKGSTIKNKHFCITAISPIKDFKDVNNNSLVLDIVFYQIRMLFVGDIEEEAEKEYLKILEPQTYQILKVAHHGSSTSSIPSFLEKIRPKIGIAENGYSNTFSFPSVQTIKTFQNLEIPLYNTKDYGTLTIKIKKGKIKLFSSF